MTEETLNKGGNSLTAIIWQTPFLKGVLMLVLASAVLLPAYDLFYVYPSFEKLLIKSMENDAKRTAKHILHMINDQESEDSIFTSDGMTPQLQEQLSDVASDFSLWKARVFSTKGKILFSTTTNETDTYNESPYFHQSVAKGRIFSKVEHKSGKSMEGEVIPVDIVEIYVPVMNGKQFKGAFEIYYDISEEWTLLQTLLRNTGALLLLLMLGFLFVAVTLVIKSAREHRLLTITRSELNRQERLFHDVIQAAQDAIIVTDYQQRILLANPAFTELTGFSQNEVLGKTPAIMKSGRHNNAFYREMWQTLVEEKHWRGEIWNRRKDGSVFPGLLSISTIDDNSEEGVQHVGIYIDISKQKVQEERYQKMAFHDPLTSLPNRVLFMDRLEKSMHAALRTDENVGLFFIDLDGFKQVNDMAGHLAGDALLLEIAQRLTGLIRKEDTAARLGGDEFTLVIHGAKERETFERIATNVVESLRQPIILDQVPKPVYISASVGIAIYQQDSEVIEELVSYADKAMYVAKRTGKNRYVFYADT